MGFLPFFSPSDNEWHNHKFEKCSTPKKYSEFTDHMYLSLRHPIVLYVYYCWKRILNQGICVLGVVVVSVYLCKKSPLWCLQFSIVYLYIFLYSHQLQTQNKTNLHTFPLSSSHNLSFSLILQLRKKKGAKEFSNSLQFSRYLMNHPFKMDLFIWLHIGLI